MNILTSQHHFEIDPVDWKKIFREKKTQLVGHWTHVFYDTFVDNFDECCPLSFKFNRLSKQGRQKGTYFYMAKAKCMYPNCPRRYIFQITKKPNLNKPIGVDVSIYGSKEHTGGNKRKIYLIFYQINLFNFYSI